LSIDTDAIADISALARLEPGWSSRPVHGDQRSVHLAMSLLRAGRPKQWIKNVLVFGAPGAAGLLTHPAVLARTTAAFGIFCLAASGTYLVNDTIDVEADRLHPVKCRRPIASGEVPIRVALGAATAAIVLSVALAALLSWKLAAVTAIYAALTISYTLRLKNEPVLDIGAVAGGFVLRAVAGGVAVGIPLSSWFLIVASFGSLFMVVGKRQGEHTTLGADRAQHRETLATYTLEYLRYIRNVASAGTILAYCLWAFDRAGMAGTDVFWFQLSIAPFILGIFRYGLLIEGGLAEAPEEAVMGDRVLQVLGLMWTVLFAFGVYGVR
jgi:decaprenyl-phosphate phosphoribosyltransferase